MDKTERPFKITIGGTEYAASLLSEEHVIVMTTMRTSGDALMRSVRTLCRVVESAVGRDAWDEITDRWMAGEITFADVGEAAPDLLKLTLAHHEQSKTGA